jgi:transcriptional regulator with XRE-family HTH domain
MGSPEKEVKALARDVGARLREARGLTSRRELAKRSRVDRDTIQRCEEGEPLTLIKYARLCHALGLTLRDVLGR